MNNKDRLGNTGVIARLLLTAFIFTGTGQVNADESDMQKEIAHLLGFVENTDCLYIRNGTEHTGKQAVEHIRRKYDYFRDEIDSTEKFIELSATKSTLSGKFYMVSCNGESKIRSREWLLRELEKYRNAES